MPPLKVARLTEFEGVALTSRTPLKRLLREGKLYTLPRAAEIAGRHPVYLRKLCTRKRVAHFKLLGRFYMTPAQVSALLRPVQVTA